MGGQQQREIGAQSNVVKMIPEINALRACLQMGVAGGYTPATLIQLAQTLSYTTLAEGGSVLVAGASGGHWADLALQDLALPIQRSNLVISGTGVALIGIGSSYGYALVAIPMEPLERDADLQLYDAQWSCAPEDLLAIGELLDGAIPILQRAALLRLQPPPSSLLLHIANQALDFAARQHVTLTLANRSLNDRLRNHEDQTHMIVHDMRAPLHTLLISLKALQRQGFDPNTHQELLGVAQESANYLLSLVNTVLDSARLETSSWSLQLQPTNLVNLIKAVCDPLRQLNHIDQPQVRVDIPAELPIVPVDTHLIERVLTNLISNAMKFTPAGGEVRITAQVTNSGHSVEIRVSDTGYGIPAEAQTHIFERFYQARDHDRRHGTGLGLYFCRLAVEAHGGSIALESEVGRGSTFIVQLPVRV
ncbi:MAG: HAMP domain-containing histidine kinase [Chloroflexus sp.]|nr:HAMP domain-containing histidine kinase [Chloroflexus sp.]MBO9314228.1 HAMP domain-containing histidine kinase [Chloroflexus sp.]MBO9318833.1 HAMP domain-containing histidine kinase [Chloroflexus sp.]